MVSPLLAVAVGFSLLASTTYTVSAHGNQPWMDTIMLEESVRSDVWYWKIEATVHCESAHYDMRVIQGTRWGALGEQGPVQLLPGPRGMLRVFYAAGYDNPYNFRQSVRFLTDMVLKGYKHYWSCYPR